MRTSLDVFGVSSITVRRKIFEDFEVLEVTVEGDGRKNTINLFTREDGVNIEFLEDFIVEE